MQFPSPLRIAAVLHLLGIVVRRENRMEKTDGKYCAYVSYVCMYIGFDSWLHLSGFPFERTTRVRFGLGLLES